MNKNGKRYYRELKALIPSAGIKEKNFKQNIRVPLDEFLHENPTADYTDICERFGSPKEVVIGYYENVDIEVLLKKLKTSHLVKKGILAVIIIIAVAFAIKTGLYYDAYLDAQEQSIDHYIETIE